MYQESIEEEDQDEVALKSVVSINIDQRLVRKSSLARLITTKRPLAILIQDLPCLVDGEQEIRDYFERAAWDYEPIFSAASSDSQSGSAPPTLSRDKYQNVTLVHKSATILDKSSLNQEQASALAVAIKPHPLNKLQTLTLINVYIRPHSTHAQVTRLLSWISTATCGPNNMKMLRNSIIMGDFNAASALWTPLNTVSEIMQNYNRFSKLKLVRGRMLGKFMATHNLTCLNRPELGPTFKSNLDGHESYIDLAFAAHAALKTGGWSVFKIERAGHGWQHRMICVESSSTTSGLTNSRREVRPILKLNSIKQSHYADLSSSGLGRYAVNWQRLDTAQICSRMNMLASQLVSYLRKTEDDITEWVTVNQRPNSSARHYGESLFKRLHKLKHIQQQQQRLQIKMASGTHQNVGMNGNRRSRRRQCLRQKRKRLLKSLKRVDIWRRVNLVRGCNNTNSNGHTRSRQDLNQLVEDMYPREDRSASQFLMEEAFSLTSSNHFLGKLLITDQEIDSAVGKLQRKSFRGADKVSFRVFNASYRYVDHIVKAICKMSFHTCHVPSVCQTTRGTLIPKPNGKHRLLHISTALSTVLEAIAHQRLAHCFETLNLFSPHQFGFSPTRGRHDLVAEILKLYHETTLDEPTLRGKVNNLTIVNLDIEAAFDRVNHNMLIQMILSKLGQNPIKIWLCNFLLHRRIIIAEADNLESASSSRVMSRGVPQGSKLGPLLWNFAIHDLLNAVNAETSCQHHSSIRLLAYADDLFIVHRHGHSQDCCLQQTLDSINARLTTASLSVNITKSSFMTTTETSGLPPPLFLNTDQLSESNSMNILGVHVDKNLKLVQSNGKKNHHQHCHKLELNILLLNTMHRLKLVNSSFEWKLLLDSLIKSFLVYNNLPVLAVDLKAIRRSESQFILAIRQIFEWPVNTSTKLIHSLFNTPSITNQIVRAIHKESVLKPAYRFLYTHLINMLRDRHEMQQLPPSQWVTHLNGMPPIPRRVYPNPELLIQPHQVTADNRLQPSWIISHEGGRGSLITLNFYEVIIDHFLAQHSQYSIPYFNTLSALWNLVNLVDVSAQACRRISFDQHHPLLEALLNIHNHDWRTIELREKLAEDQWQVVVVKRDLNHYHPPPATNASDPTTLLKSLKPQQLSEPDVSDYMDLNLIRRIHNALARVNLNQHHVTTLMRLLKLNSKLLSTCNPSRIACAQVLALTGLISIKNSCNNSPGNLTSGSLVRGQMAHGCTDEKTCITTLSVSHTTFHRMMECPRFSVLRQACQARIGLALPSNLETIFNNATKRAHFLSFIAYCAFEDAPFSRDPNS